MSMPTVAQVNRALGGNVHALTRNAHAEQRAADDAARREREISPSGNETVSGSVVCPLTSSSADGTPMSVRVPFGRIAFTGKPSFLGGGGKLNGSSEAIWGLVRVDDTSWETDAAGLYRAVSVVAGYVGTPVYATSITIDYLFIGPALRLG
jgi:hypothetical protein